MPKPTLDRRQVLFFGSASAALTVLQGCDNLVLPPVEEGDPIEEIEPITSNRDFYTYSYSGPPDPELLENWELVISDRGVDLATIDEAFLAELDVTEFEHTLQCIGSSPRNRLISNAIWGGKRLDEVLALLGVAVDDQIIEMRFETADGYHTSIPITDLDDPVWLVWQMNGEPLPHAHGAPARLIVPRRYGTKNPKWLTRIDFVDTEYIGHWEDRGWSKEAIYKANGFIMWPNHGAVLPLAPLLLVGTSYAGEDPVATVEITFDGGETWEPCDLDYAPGANRWALWSYAWEPQSPGQYKARLRVTTDSGVVSHEDPFGSDRLAGYDAGMEIDLTIA